MIAALAVLATMPGVQPQWNWTAYPVSEEAAVVNPAFLAWQPDFLLSAGFTMSDSAFERVDRASVAMPGMGLSGYWNSGSDIRTFTAGSSLPVIGGAFSLGTSYTWFDPTAHSDWDGKSFWILGLGARPVEWLSLGAMRRGGVTAGGIEHGAEYRIGASVRPSGPDITLSADVSFIDSTAGEGWSGDPAFSGGLEVRPLDGLTLRACGSEHGFSTGIWTDFGNLGLGASSSFDDEGEYGGTRGGVRITGRPRENLVPERGRFVRIVPGEFTEERTRGFFSPCSRSFSEDAMLLAQAAGDPSVSGVIVDLRRGCGTQAQAEELRGLLADIRSGGKPVVMYANSAGNMEIYLSSAATAFYCHPSGEVALSGLSATGLFLRDFLDRLGIYPDLLHVGEYKSASDMLTRSDMSDAQREAETALIRSFELELFSRVTAGRGLEPAAVRSLLERGPMTPEEAVGAGLVDGIAYQDEIEDRIESETGSSPRSEDLGTYSDRQPVSDEWGPGEHVAVIVATGFITTGRSGSAFPIGETMGSETIADLVERAKSEPGTRAIVLRIDSGGGDALASEDMLHALQQAGEEMPVVVSMGAVAGSGGYYIACAGDSIFADNMTITGSIGVISGKLVFAGLMERLGIASETLTDWPYAGMSSMLSTYTDEQREAMERMIDDSYRLFAGRVAEARGMTFEQVDSIGRGRVWAGADAVANGLVDRIGGIEDAVLCAAGMAGMEEGLPEIEVYPSPGFFGSLPSSPLGILGLTAGGEAGSVLDLEALRLLQGRLYLMQPSAVR